MQAMSGRSGPAPGGQLPSLPLDVLQKVASLMPLKDWARASGACRLMHTLQLDVIEVATLTCEHVGFRQQERSAGLQWASKRWRCARCLRLEITAYSTRELAAVLFSQQPEERPSSLQELSFMCNIAAPNASTLLPWLASCTPQLSVLLCSATSLPFVPPLAQLKHLVLAQASQDFSHVAEALPRLQGLQTLSLECARRVANPIPVLDLQGLGDLRQLVLDNVAAKRLALPTGCRMSVRMQGDTSMFDWASALPVLQSQHLLDFVVTQQPTIADLQACTCLRDLRLHTNEALGKEGSPCSLGGALARLDSLALIAQELRLAVPMDACWRVVKLHSHQRLSVTFEDVRAFAAAADTFCFEGPRPGGNGPWPGGFGPRPADTGFDRFGEALTGLGKRWASSALPDTGGNMAVMHSLKNWCATRCAHTGQEECICGACTRCLHQAGVISALPEVHHPAGYIMPGMALFPIIAPHDDDDDPSDGFDNIYGQDWDEEYEEEWDEEYEGEHPFEGVLDDDYVDDGPDFVD